MLKRELPSSTNRRITGLIPLLCLQAYPNKISKLLFIAFLVISVGLISALGQGSPIERKSDDISKAVSDIANFHSKTHTESLGYLFALPPKRFDTILRSVTNSNVNESKGAQLLVRYIGDGELFDRMLKVCDARCFLSGPVPLPLRSMDVREIEHLLSRDICALGEFEMKYIFAIFFDKTPSSREFRKRIEEKALGCSSDSILRSRIKSLQTAPGLLSGSEAEPSVETVRANLFFLTPDEREHAEPVFIGLNFQKDRALYEILVDNGVLATRYFHIIFAKGDKNKWRFHSVTTVSQS